MKLRIITPSRAGVREDFFIDARSMNENRNMGLFFFGQLHYTPM
jgi:hypothetical protein